MDDALRNIIREELENALSNKYSNDEINDAIMNKHFIHTKNGKVYSPVVLNKDFVVGVDNDCQHINIPLDEITLIQSKNDRFKNQ